MRAVANILLICVLGRGKKKRSSSPGHDKTSEEMTTNFPSFFSWRVSEEQYSSSQDSKSRLNVLFNNPEERRYRMSMTAIDLVSWTGVPF